MMSSAWRCLDRLVLIAILGSPSVALAADPEAPIEIGVGVMGVLRGLWQASPDDAELSLPRSQDTVAYPDFSGVAPGVGVLLEARWRGVIGLEIGPYYGRDRLRGTSERDGTSVTVHLAQSSFHLPVLFKAVWSNRTLSPLIVIGPEWVFTGITKTHVEPEGALGVVADAGPATWFTLGLGAEWNVPAEGIELRVPLVLRLSTNITASSDVADRVTVLPSDALVLDSSVHTQLAVLLGTSVHF